MSEMITQQKKKELEEELLHLKTVVRPAISERLQAARALGDLSENAEYQTSRNDQGKNESRIQQIEAILKHSSVIEHTNTGVVSIGSTITVKKTSDASEKTYMLVGNAEADISQNKITQKSPIGESIFGKNVGDTFVIDTPRGPVEYEIISIS